MNEWDFSHPAFDDYCRTVRKRRYWHHDETLEKCERFVERLNAGLDYRGAVPLEQP